MSYLTRKSYEIKTNIIEPIINNKDLNNNKSYNNILEIDYNLQNKNPIYNYETKIDNNLYSFSNNYHNSYNSQKYNSNYDTKQVTESDNLVLTKYNNDNYKNEYNN